VDAKDYYQVLNLPEDAAAAQVRAAYRELAFRYHPDRNAADPAAAEKMKQINEAYAVLSQPEKRREYDRLRQRYGSAAHRRFREGFSEQDIFNGSDIHQVFEEMARAFGVRGYHDIFREFYGKGYQTFQFKRPGFFMGGFVFTGSLGRTKPGKERIAIKDNPLGNLIQGVVRKAIGVHSMEKGKDLYDVITLDRESARKGGPYAYFHRKRSKKLVVNLPQNVQDGQKIRLAGMGEAGKGGQPGDLYLKIRIQRPLLDRVQRFLFRKGG
jgi:DnaJ-class molecular chaperone